MNTTPFVFLFLISISVALSAQDDIVGAVNDDTDNSSRPASIGEFIDYNISNNASNGFSAHKQNYLLPYTSSDNGDGRQKHEMKFQISVKQRLLRFYGWAVYFGFTQKSFWQFYDTQNSRPFRENDFNPELFLRTKMWFGIRTDFGIEHESNGQVEATSRSWNRLYLIPYYENSFIIAYCKLWYRFPERKKRDINDAQGDDNPDIHKYYGNGELGLTLKMPQLRNLYISAISRYNFRYQKGSVEINATLPMYLSSMSFMVQYWNGYGESLIDYNVRQQKIGFGFNFTR
jgi:phospholipase A1/A2